MPDADFTPLNVLDLATLPVNARDCGAFGDDQHDDTAAIQFAIALANRQGRAVFFPPGTYRISGTLEA